MPNHVERVKERRLVVAIKGLASHLNGFPRHCIGTDLLGNKRRANKGLKSLEQWFEAENIHPAVAAEVEDMALLQVLGDELRRLESGRRVE
jgi:hypothetical protein